jgi:hypothetical protein
MTLAPPKTKIKVVAPEEGKYAVWVWKIYSFITFNIPTNSYY